MEEREAGRSAFEERAASMLVHWAELLNLGAYRLSGGSYASTIGGAPVLLLTVSGRRTGTRRTKPLLGLPDGDGWLVVASRGGAAEDPAWFTNLLAYERDPGAPHLEAPVVECEGRPPVAVRARVLDGEERDRCWARLTAVYPRFDDYQARAPRVIPVVRLAPAH